MISTAKLVETISQANGEGVYEIQARIGEVAEKLGIEPVADHTMAYDGDVWYDDDADAICMEIKP